MAKLWTGNKTWQGNTTPVAGTKYLVGAANGKCSYQTFSAGQTKRCLVSNGANGNIAYQNISMPASYLVSDITTPLTNFGKARQCVGMWESDDAEVVNLTFESTYNRFKMSNRQSRRETFEGSINFIFNSQAERDAAETEFNSSGARYFVVAYEVSGVWYRPTYRIYDRVSKIDSGRYYLGYLLSSWNVDGASLRNDAYIIPRKTELTS